MAAPCKRIGSSDKCPTQPAYNASFPERPAHLRYFGNLTEGSGTGDNEAEYIECKKLKPFTDSALLKTV